MQTGRVIDGRYEVLGELGRGSMGVVYRARDIGLGRQVALKIIAPEYGKSVDVVRAFQKEARALASLRSDHVVQVFAAGVEEGSLFFAMEFVNGRSLEDCIEEHLSQNAVVGLTRSLTILQQVASGLDAVHRADIVHRDVKPSNIVIEDRTGRPVVIDFGLAVGRADKLSGLTRHAGTPTYMSPEQIDGKDITSLSDVYSFACTAFELLTGTLPFNGSNVQTLMIKHKLEPPPLLSSRRPDLRAADEVLVRALAKKPEDRFQTCTELVRAIEEKLDHTEPGWFSPVSHRSSQHTLPPTSSKFEILVVDDDPTFASFVSRAATIAFHGVPNRISVAHDGRAALERATESPPQLVTLDYDMPGMDGIETLARLRGLPRGTEARVLVMSATAGEDQHWRFGVLGIEDFIRKPIQLPQLMKIFGQVTLAAGWESGIVKRKSPLSQRS